MLWCLAVAGCGERATVATSEPLSDDVMGKWTRSCALCHVDGTGGAPRIGHAEDWQERIAQGEEALLTHAIEGLDNMPPLGYCMSCSREDFAALIKFMTGSS